MGGKMRAFYGAFLLIVLFAFLTFAIADELFVDNHDGTVTDTSSKLIWQGDYPRSQN
jgi:hypothetical protein